MSEKLLTFPEHYYEPAPHCESAPPSPNFKLIVYFWSDSETGQSGYGNIDLNFGATFHEKSREGVVNYLKENATKGDSFVILNIIPYDSYTF